MVRNLFPDLSPGARKAIVHRAIQSGEILRLKPGLFCLHELFRKTHLHPFVLAGAIYFPSHVSLESALHHHGLIPEAVYQVASVIPARSRVFRTPLGEFSFQRVPTRYPRAGVRAVRFEPEGWAFVASPLRAIADLVYLRKEVSWGRDGMAFLLESMRMELDQLREVPLEDHAELLESLRNQRTKSFLAGLYKELTR